MFEVIGERINTSRKNVQNAVVQKDAQYIIDDVMKQQEAGAAYIDVNAGARIGHETDDMQWLLNTILPIATVPLCLDSPDPLVLEMGFQMIDDGSRPKHRPMINSISLEKDRFDTMIPFLNGKDCKVIALCMDDSGMPDSSDAIISRADTLVKELNAIGINTGSVYIDPLVQPISTDSNKGVMVLDAVRGIKDKHPDVHISCGLSNISYGLPQRKIINRTFVTLMMDAGTDSAIIDPLDEKIMATIKTADMLLGNDDYCGNFLKGVRAGSIQS